LQVGAFGTRKPADTLMTRLKKKGYAAYVFTAPSGPSRFKVRVGPFADRAAADTASARLKKEEGLSPLVQR
jgi:cell division septation protein DedD